jgi:cell division septation protein DedD
VEADVVDTLSPVTGLSAEIQVGVFRSGANAQRLADTLGTLHDQVGLSVSSGGLYIVSVGPFSEKQDADRIAGEIRAETGLVPLVRLTRLD